MAWEDEAQRQERHQRSKDVRLHARAIIEGWDTPQETRPATIEYLTQVMRGDIETDPRTRMMAARALMHTVSLQIDAARLAMDQRTHSDERKSKSGKAVTRREVVERARQIALERDRRTDGASGPELPRSELLQRCDSTAESLLEWNESRGGGAGGVGECDSDTPGCGG